MRAYAQSPCERTPGKQPAPPSGQGLTPVTMRFVCLLFILQKMALALGNGSDEEA